MQLCDQYLFLENNEVTVKFQWILLFGTNKITASYLIVSSIGLKISKLSIECVSINLCRPYWRFVYICDVMKRDAGSSTKSNQVIWPKCAAIFQEILKYRSVKNAIREILFSIYLSVGLFLLSTYLSLILDHHLSIFLDHIEFQFFCFFFIVSSVYLVNSIKSRSIFE